jgi:aminopeptidase YwaD
MKRAAIVVAVILESLLVSANTLAQQPPLLPEKTVSALAGELSGETAKRNLEFLARLHRQRGSRDFHSAAEFMVARARDYGLADAHIEQFPADGKIFYGTQRSRPAWDADFAELWEMKQQGGQWAPVERLGDFQAMPVTLAEDSESADVTADLIDVGSGTSEQDYAGKDVRGKIVLVSAQPGGEVEALAIEKFGAAGIVSYAQNQPNAWQGEDDNLVRWGHLDSFPKTPTFAFMVSLRTARALRDRLVRGESIRLHAIVKAGRHAGFYDVATAVIPGADPKLSSQEIVFSCHLDHERPGANDNASGCVTILEIARTLQKLIAEDRIPRPARTLRFVWPAEVEGTLALLNGKPELVPHILAVVHMDMVGGGEVTKSIFHVTRAPMSLPTFLNDVAEAFGEFVNEQSYEFAATGHAAYPLVAPEGSKQALLAQFSEFTPGSDHDVYECGSYRIPAIYLNDWPDRYIHTNFDAAGNIDPTKLLRAAFIGGAGGYFLASFGQNDVAPAIQQIEADALRRTATTLQRRDELQAENDVFNATTLVGESLTFESDTFASIQRFQALTAEQEGASNRFVSDLAHATGVGGVAGDMRGDQVVVFSRSAEPKGVMVVFGYDYFADHYGASRARSLKVSSFEGLRGSGEDYAYEILNFVDGKRNAQQIRDAVSAEYGPIPFAYVIEYLRALESIGILQVKK